MQNNDLTIIVATIPEREQLLAEAIASVTAQTAPCQYKVGLDRYHNGPAATFNALGATVETDWLCPLGDDDLLDPDHVEVLSHWLDDDADIVYTWPRVEGGGEDHPEDQFQARWQALHGWEHLRVANWITACAAIRTDLWHRLGGYQPVDWTDHEDWAFWVCALDAGARFRCIPAVTFTYRMNPEWEHVGARRDALT
jgi:hypothetical protein